MAKEVEENFAYLFNNNVPFVEFYTADYTFLDATLANYYGINRNDGGAGADKFVKTPTSTRGGVNHGRIYDYLCAPRIDLAHFTRCICPRNYALPSHSATACLKWRAGRING